MIKKVPNNFFFSGKKVEWTALLLNQVFRDGKKEFNMENKIVKFTLIRGEKEKNLIYYNGGQKNEKIIHLNLYKNNKSRNERKI